MSGIVERELRAAFDAASDFIQPVPALADRARQARRSRRRRQLAIGLVCCAVAVVVGGAYGIRLTTGGDLTHRSRSPRVLVRVDFGASQAAVNGPYLYLASNSSSLVAAYDRQSGKLLRQVSVPGSPTSLTVGPAGLIWVGVQGDSTSGTPTLLSPDLSSRAQALTLLGPLVPTGRQTAVAASQYGLIAVRMPAPGQPGRASQHLEPGTSLGPPLNTAPNAWAGRVDGRVVVQVTDGYGYHIHLVIAGQPTRTFGGSLGQEVGAVTSIGNTLWVQTFVIRNSNAAASGPLVRLDGQLRVTTPVFVQRSPVLAKSEAVWSAGDTVWVATGAARHSLVCFSATSRNARVITVQRAGAVATLAATAGTVYVITTAGDSFGPSVVTSYPVPAACR